MGLACDWRVVLHELGGHGILYQSVNSPNFGFAHSAGDSFAAILNDPETRAADRFQTFPWVFGVINRRHDRSVTAGWAWGGVNDVGGYSSEQILCTTHFRLYLSIGGDSSGVAMRTYASRYVAYLMLRTIGSLTQPTNPGNPTSYASALMTAELGNWTSADQVGGVYWKVIRWAFEKQGLFQPPGAPVPVVSEGAPPPVDLYIEDGRHGEYPLPAELLGKPRDLESRRARRPPRSPDADRVQEELRLRAGQEPRNAARCRRAGVRIPLPPERGPGVAGRLRAHDHPLARRPWRPPPWRRHHRRTIRVDAGPPRARMHVHERDRARRPCQHRWHDRIAISDGTHAGMAARALRQQPWHARPDSSARRRRPMRPGGSVLQPSILGAKPLQ
jgi:hypothetical protein